MGNVDLYFPLRPRKGEKEIQLVNTYFSRLCKQVPVWKILYPAMKRNLKQYCLNNTLAEFKLIPALNSIIPNEYFGCLKNKKLLYAIAKKVMNRLTKECIYSSELWREFRIDKISWIVNSKLEKHLHRTYLFYGNVVVIQRIIHKLISRYYTGINIGKGIAVKLIPRKEKRSFEDQVFNKMLASKCLVKIKGHVEPRGLLRIISKTEDLKSLNYRPICYLLDRRIRPFYKTISKRLNMYAKEISPLGNTNIFESWEGFVNKHKNEKLYGVVLDVSDAFGNVKKDKLSTVIRNSWLPSYIKTEALNFINNTYIGFRKNRDGTRKIYKWMHGLPQGDILSASLCQIYMNLIDSETLMEFPKETCLIYRYVDDYFFCSTDGTLVKRFIEVMSENHKINLSKTQSTSEDTCELNYIGYTFDLATKEVRHYLNAKNFHTKYKFWNIEQQKAPIEFIKRATHYPYNNFHFSKILINLKYNSYETSLKNFYLGIVLVAFKTIKALNLSGRTGKSIQNIISLIINTIYYYSFRSFITLRINGGFWVDDKQIHFFFKIAAMAFINVFKKENKKFKCLLKVLRHHILGHQVDVGGINMKYFQKLPKCYATLCVKRAAKSDKLK